MYCILYMIYRNRILPSLFFTFASSLTDNFIFFTALLLTLTLFSSHLLFCLLPLFSTYLCSSLILSSIIFSSFGISSPASLTIVDSTYKIHSTHSTQAVRTIFTVRRKQRNTTIQLKSSKTMNESSILLAQYLS